MDDPPEQLDYHRGRPSPFEDQPGPLTWRLVAWRAGLVLLLAILSLIFITSGSWIIMQLYR